MTPFEKTLVVRVVTHQVKRLRERGLSRAQARALFTGVLQESTSVLGLASRFGMGKAVEAAQRAKEEFAPVALQLFDEMWPELHV